MNFTFNEIELTQIDLLFNKIKDHTADPENSPEASWAEVYAFFGIACLGRLA